MTDPSTPPAMPHPSGRRSRAAIVALVLAFLIAASTGVLLWWAGGSHSQAGPVPPTKPAPTSTAPTTSDTATPPPPVPTVTVTSAGPRTTHVTVPNPPPPVDYGLAVHVSTAAGSYTGPCATGGSARITYQAVVSVTRGPVTVALGWQYDDHAGPADRTLPRFTGSGAQEQTVTFTSDDFSGTHTGWVRAHASVVDPAVAVANARSEQAGWSYTCTSPTLTLITPSAGTIAYWDYYTVRITGFLPGERVDLTYDGASTGTLPAVTAGATTGAVDLTVHAIQVPGRYVIHAHGELSDSNSDASLTITP